MMPILIGSAACACKPNAMPMAAAKSVLRILVILSPGSSDKRWAKENPHRPCRSSDIKAEKSGKTLLGVDRYLPRHELVLAVSVQFALCFLAGSAVEHHLKEARPDFLNRRGAVNDLAAVEV